MVFPEIITVNDSLIITAFSMLLVFAALIILSFTIDGFRLITNNLEKKNKSKTEPIDEANKQVTSPIVEKTTNQEEDTELIAVITASIAAMLSKPANNIVVKNIIRIPQTTPVWGSISRQEMINK
ncbi:OadG family protein [Proteiniborus sp. MB09-C3]|uniref:OadG family protein n=1 Tax=Proteiniborus sp. MB09-C3 TaxID=3050072 RepID=UPI002553C23A|nr:OadG family protein [Proteiniborus sp. MB09-C3]WIV13547.1 OadG family protein [Proteiniborus sp. MB09-C3]